MNNVEVTSIEPATFSPAGAMVMRLDPQPGETIDRRRCFSFRWNGKRFPAFSGDTIASALAACGEKVFSRSFKYHRPRGLLTASFLDPNCIFQVGDEPNVRGAHRLVEPDMEVRAQNAWPSVHFDVKSMNRLLGRFLGAGFYYKTFIKPRRLQPVYQRILRQFAAGGKIASHSLHSRYDHRYVHPEVLVAGGGPAGIAAAIGAAKAGARVMLVEEEHEIGGHLRWGNTAELAHLNELRRQIGTLERIEVLTNSVVSGRYDDNWIAIVQRQAPTVVERLIKARAKILVVAAGLVERPYVFEGNDLPGVVLSSAVRRLINLYAVKPGNRAAIFTANDEGDRAVDDLRRVRVEVAAVVDARRGGNILRACGRNGLKTVEFSDGSNIACDLLVTAVGWTAPTSLLNMAGAKPMYEPGAARFAPGKGLPENVLVTGGLAGDGSLVELIAHGEATGAVAAARAGHGPAQPVPHLSFHDHPALFQGLTDGIVDYSEDVSSKDLVQAVQEGFDSVELLKRYTTATMGPAQGKLETVNSVAILAKASKQTMAEIGTTVWRPPYAPVSLGVMAGRLYEPIRVSPIHPWHQARGATKLVAGQWIRPGNYGDAADEVRNTRNNVGIIDVTPLGKFDIRGSDTVGLLERMYVNKWRDLKVGSVRYGIMCDDDGVIYDDGVTGRLADNRYFMSATSSGAAAVWERMENQLQTVFPQWQVHVIPATTAYASINVAGPKSRTLLARLVEAVDLSPQAFPYMRVRIGRIAGVDDCILWRVGFVGELSFEIHVPASYGLYIWETLLDSGKDLEIKPFGIEAQRIMRLEKGHLIVGQDTDGLTKAYSAGLGALVKLDKEDFLGKPELAWQARQRSYPRLVGIQPVDGSIVPPEGCQLVRNKTQIVGRITSSAMSPTLGRSICLGFVAPELAEAGTVVSIRMPDGAETAATVMAHTAHFDPEGVRLHG